MSLFLTSLPPPVTCYDEMLTTFHSMPQLQGHHQLPPLRWPRSAFDSNSMHTEQYACLHLKHNAVPTTLPRHHASSFDFWHTSTTAHAQMCVGTGFVLSHTSTVKGCQSAGQAYGLCGKTDSKPNGWSWKQTGWSRLCLTPAGLWWRMTCCNDDTVRCQPYAPRLCTWSLLSARSCISHYTGKQKCHFTFPSKLRLSSLYVL